MRKINFITVLTDFYRRFLIRLDPTSILLMNTSDEVHYPGAFGVNIHYQLNSPGSDSDAVSKKNTRRSVACKNCHSLKVKCTPSDENNPSAPCIRCINTKKVCEINLNQPRKRRKKAEIEEEREMMRLKSNTDASNMPIMSNILQIPDQLNFLQYPVLNQAPNIAGNQAVGDVDTAALIARLTNEVSTLTSQVEYYKSKSKIFDGNSNIIRKEDLQHEIDILSKNSGKSFLKVSCALKDAANRRNHKIDHIWNNNKGIDFLSQGLISESDAQTRMDLYYNSIYPNFPYIDFDETLTAVEFAKQQPYLFNAVMATASVVIKNASESLCEDLEMEAARALMTQILIAGNKTEELLKSVMLMGFWYNTPELVKHRRFHILNALSISMLHDLGIVSKADQKKPLLDNHLISLQERKIVMLLYISTVSTCLILRRTVYVQWTPYVEECCKFLENSGEKELLNLAIFSRLNQLLEKTHNLLHGDSSGDNTLATSYIVKDFQTQLSHLKAKLTEDDHAILAYYYAVEGYLHEPLLSQVTGVNEQGGQLFFKEDSVRSIAKSTRSCIECLKEFLKLGVDFIATLPLVYISRMIYTAGILLRMRYLILSVPLKVEKSLMPVEAILTVQKTNDFFLEASKSYPNNFFLKKTSLMLQLFIQIYANQVQAFLRSNADTPILMRETDDELAKYLLNSSKATSGDTRNNSVALDVLSYAATLKKELHVVNEFNEKVKKDIRNSVSQESQGQSESPTPQKATKLNTVSNDDFVNPEPVLTPNNFSTSSKSPASVITNANSFFGIPGFEEIDHSVYNIGEEYWSDIVNPTSNNFNLEGKGGVSNDVFFMT